MEISYKKALIQILSFLEEIERKNGIKYYIVGGVLTSIYSETRFTQDIDFVVDIYPVNHSIETYIELLKKYKFFPYQDWNTTTSLATATQLIQYLDEQEKIKFDNYIIDRQNPSKYKRISPKALKRRVRVILSGIECWATSKEDYILSKLIFGGWQDYSDALGCWMRFDEEFDIQYMEEVSKELGILKEFNLLKSGIEDPDEYFEKLNNYR